MSRRPRISFRQGWPCCLSGWVRKARVVRDEKCDMVEAENQMETWEVGGAPSWLFRPAECEARVVYTCNWVCLFKINAQ